MKSRACSLIHLSAKQRATKVDCMSVLHEWVSQTHQSRTKGGVEGKLGEVELVLLALGRSSGQGLTECLSVTRQGKTIMSI